jgi:alkylated DNA repair dioxygenase AlkB
MPHRPLAQTVPLFESLPGAPTGLRYIPDFLTSDQEAELLTHVEELEFGEVRMHGVAARRTTTHFGWGYDYDARKLAEPIPVPDFVLGLRQSAADLIGVPAAEFAEILVTRYPEGATIGWHRDAPMFGPAVVGVSLLSPCDMRFRRRSGDSFVRFTQRLEPRSAYVLDGPARSVWQHSIPPVPTLRYSITFRTLRASSH